MQIIPQFVPHRFYAIQPFIITIFGKRLFERLYFFKTLNKIINLLPFLLKQFNFFYEKVIQNFRRRSDEDSYIVLQSITYKTFFYESIKDRIDIGTRDLRLFTNLPCFRLLQLKQSHIDTSFWDCQTNFLQALFILLY